jgi:GT2 family glycosyltransferase
MSSYDDVALIVPVLNNFTGLTKLIESVDIPVLPIVINNWDDNRGVSRGWNIGISTAIERGCEYAVVVNDDVILRPGVIHSMTSKLTDSVILSSPVNETGQGHPRGLNFWCFAIKPQQFVDTVGWFDENFFPAYFEDDDMAYRIKLARRQIAWSGTKAYHQVWGSTRGVNLDWSKNEEYYERKWGGPAGSEKFMYPFNDDNKTLKDW